MIPPLDTLIERLTSALPPHLSEIKQDMQQHCRAVLQNTLKDWQLVTREEFDVQQQVLLKTRKQLETLEKHIHELEKKIQNNQ
jgi:BMFP domain-containing protein YqiC